MTRREKEKYRDKVRNNLCQIRKGDKVQIVSDTVKDHPEYSIVRSKVYEVTSDPYPIGKDYFVNIAGFGSWDIGVLEKVNV